MPRQVPEKHMQKIINPQSTKKNTKTLISLKEEFKVSERSILIKSVISQLTIIREIKAMLKIKG